MTKRLIIRLDASGSMDSDNKWKNAIEGVKSLWEKDFGEKEMELISQYKTAYTPSEIPSNCGGGTPLYLSLGKLLSKLQKEEQIVPTVVAIFTDGEDTCGCSNDWPIQKMKSVIQELSDKGIAFTFIGTEKDVKTMNLTFGISEDNVAVHNNTGQGFAKSIAKFENALEVYSKDIDKGVANTRSFYSKSIQ